MNSIDELSEINESLKPLQKLADRERKAIRGLTGLLHTPHIDAYNELLIKRAQLLLSLKAAGVLPYSEVEITTQKLTALFNKAKNKEVVEHNGNHYERRFSPLKLSKSGKVVRKWAKYWLLKHPDGAIDSQWQTEVRELWPEYFVIQLSDIS
ncbi:hypothetical protein [Thalassotalea sediminis]|uniref:hypothetical protein n=1 Tax=Thalassotalea sediminis TaxID=1759089 RepID=UPI002573CC4D|nr:hypothetical protein [Thalassotalea sediminis]